MDSSRERNDVNSPAFLIRTATICAPLIVSLIFGALVWAGDVPQTKSLTAQQQLGRGIFQQRCAVCHTQPMVISKQYGPFLSRDKVVGREGAVRSTIMDGETGLMPGFRYGMEPSQVEAIIEYLKTVEKPNPPVSSWIAER
jgi:mono/diheme cytochrome c family protein